ncbi:hypothetical protein GF374_01570 [Candidatus Woesearchaeota archaeon]|nr:hypothetical protein [Candidatus Woesearchaeota archaeon]
MSNFFLLLKSKTHSKKRIAGKTTNNVSNNPSKVNLLICAKSKSKNIPWIIAPIATKTLNTNNIKICFLARANFPYF